jgi:transcriptional regulator with XRE-family HTH domain
MTNTQSFTIGPLMKAARKFKKFNQADVAKAIGCSQSALSKMEHNLLIPSAPQWFLFSRFTAIPPETLETGIIDRHSLVKFNSDEVSLGFKIPKKYRSHRAEKVREIYPFLTYLKKTRGEEAYNEFIKTTDIDPEFFLDFDNLISFQLFADTASYFIVNGVNTPEAIEELVNVGQDQIYWNHYGVEWKRLTNTKEVLLQFVNEQLFFQSDFQLQVESNGDKVVLNYLPEYHLKQFKDQSPELITFLNHYRMFSIKNLIRRVLGKEIEVEVHESSDQGLAGKFLIAG